MATRHHPEKIVGHDRDTNQTVKKRKMSTTSIEIDAGERFVALNLFNENDNKKAVKFGKGKMPQ